uniref:sensor histidine kinase n=1 Tax=Pseudactinotalea sp. TaxID=1926260 RepID=UPI003B3AF527
GSDGELGTGAPQPTITALDDLVTEAAAAGERVTLTLEGREALTSARRQLQRSVFRTVQEGMTNARKHAPGALVEVEVRATEETVAVRVANPVPVGVTPTEVPGSRAGLTGLAERIRLDGGQMSAVVTDGSFVLEAALPWRA